jgi:hypothetical protein
MIMGAFIPGLRRKYPFQEYVSAVMLVIGLILFTLADAQTSPNFSMAGVAMVSGALVMDAFLGNLQEAIFKMNPDTTQVHRLEFSAVFFLQSHFTVSTVRHFVRLDGDALLLHCCWPPVPSSTNGVNWRAHDGMDFMFPGE